MARYTRCRILLGDDFEVLRTKKVLLFGVGGVGGHCLDALYRTGVSDITIVDFDTYDITNQNRQLGSDAVGEVKVHRLAKLYPGVTPIHVKVDEEFLKNFDFTPYDIVLDAIDDVKAKVGIIRRTHKKLISSMGSAKRLDPTKIEYISIWKTHGDALAKKVRDELKGMNFKPDFKVIFSSEVPQCKEKGSFVGVTGAFGLTLAAKAIEKLTKDATGMAKHKT
ncbi:MAG TPA: ThiF family adenylyltransferase [Campylobacterales bacterium]|nr:ThiF family adenylyltransferase [Campylobacterales bacterium]